MLIGLAAMLVLPGCGLNSSESDGTEQTPTSQPTPLPPATKPAEVAEQFLSLWQQKRYNEMYDLISAASQQTITREKFVGRYEAIAEEATITGIDYELAKPADDEATELSFTVTMHTSVFGDLRQDNVMPVVLEGSQWKVEWSPSLIFKQLKGDYLIHFFYEKPKRGDIYDRKGNLLAVDADIATVGVVQDLMPVDPTPTIAALAERLQMSAPEIREKLNANVPSYYFIPIKRLPYNTPQSVIDEFYTIRGVLVRSERVRVYPYGPLAAHVLGYMGEVSPEELEELASKGYRPGDFIGKAGLEGYFESELAGEAGGKLAVITQGGHVVEVIAEKPPVAGVDIHLSIDVSVQQIAEESMGERQGSIVVINPVDNSILAMASYPDYDPNKFITGFTPEEWQKLSSDARLPFLNRATRATYPPGSTFKVVTAAAGLERGGYSASSRIRCTPLWYGLGQEFVKANWQSVDRGPLTIAEGLMASCNPVFYEVALTLDHIDPEILPSFAAAFGFGQPTGIVGVPESVGVLASPEWKEENYGEPWYSGDSVNMGIGQGFMLVTPLQVANLYSTLASGQSVRTTLLVTKKVWPDGRVEEFTSQEKNPLPVSTATLNVIRQGLSLVTNSPGGTAYQVFGNASIPFAGKSGTAEDLAVGNDHIWFVAYAPRDDPKAVAVVAFDEGKSGSFEAGPIVRRVIETYLAQGG